MAIVGYGRLYMAIVAWLWEVVHGYSWLWEVVHGYSWLWKVIHGYGW